MVYLLPQTADMLKMALIAHDGKKTELVTFALNNKPLFEGVQLYATQTTGSFLETAGFSVVKVLSGPMGGDAQIAALVAEKKMDVVFFFRDPLDKHPHEPDVQMLMRLCDVHNIPLATNPSAAKLLLGALQKRIKEAGAV
jgi:methylglyoxal synthase